MANLKSKSRKVAHSQSSSPSAAHPTSSAPKRYPTWFYGVLVLIPVLFFLLLELGLRLADYGETYPVFVTFDLRPNKLRLNPDIPRKYFRNLSVTPSPILDVFDKVKAPNALRVFVLGESSAAGWPYPPHIAFSRTIQRGLEALYPHRHIEVINLGLAAICTYTIKDFVSALIEHKPDLVIFYNGHNEYYGVLGIGSSMRFGNSRFLTNLRLFLQEFRLYQLLERFVTRLAQLATSPNEADQGTLMARVIGESAIAFGSDTYRKGLEQFEDNMRKMLSQLSAHGVPVVLGTLVSNYKDLPPFVSLNEEPNAASLFKAATQALHAGDSLKAKQLFLQAKDLDGLRFRAPEAINRIICQLATEYGAALADIQAEFERRSPYGIVGNTLICDHLHPTVEGYQLMGKVFLQTALAHHFLPPPSHAPQAETLDSLLFSPAFSLLDKTYSDLKLRLLKGSYPFVPKGQPNLLLQAFKPQNLIDTLALRCLSEEIGFEEAHYAAANFLLAQGESDAAELELQSFIAKVPFLELPYRKAGQIFIKHQRFDKALPYLQRAYAISPTAYTAKWIGQILVYQNQPDAAIPYLEQSLALGGESDSQTYYNLAGAYYQTHRLDKAIACLKRCLQLSPNYPNAKVFYEQLTAPEP
ncbi:MAG: tetratricopeptide repeat protein [Candidatus Thermochlorobacter aerophilum]|jgi:tetratricopeptide (TPR) repeat protein|uniref:Tetratricopeptide repeat protein n=1 Tax=Candidatus Thermochlorobacter aerophilus TaxID=1868324 RepID=A0A395LZL8_9BACT|nr:MAG: tetratricopeptide repeat protein [Candidatus Thermochlorobacter aerophilum]RFM23966.1 MAG: tetratricopeptide repeat protein [Candidatus Thermochlorobacter aerophilum]